MLITPFREGHRQGTARITHPLASANSLPLMDMTYDSQSNRVTHLPHIDHLRTANDQPFRRLLGDLGPRRVKMGHQDQSLVRFPAILVRVGRQRADKANRAFPVTSITGEIAIPQIGNRHDPGPLAIPTLDRHQQFRPVRLAIRLPTNNTSHLNASPLKQSSRRLQPSRRIMVASNNYYRHAWSGNGHPVKKIVIKPLCRS